MNARTLPIRRLDRRDGLMLAASTLVAILVIFVVPAPEPLTPLSPASVPPPPVAISPSPPAAIEDPAVATPAGVAAPSTVVLAPTWTVAPAAPLPEPVAVPDPGVLSKAMEIAMPFLTAWTVALLLIGLRRPRPPRRRLTRQPGLAACAVGVIVMVAVLVGYFLRWAATWLWTAIVPTSTAGAAPGTWYVPRAPLQDLWYAIHSGFGAGSAAIAEAVAAAWLIMALGGWWRPEKSGIDRLGRALGVAWIALMVVGYIAGFMP